MSGENRQRRELEYVVLEVERALMNTFDRCHAVLESHVGALK